MMYTFYQSVCSASHNQSFPSTSEEKHVFWVGFGEHVGDAITHKLLDSSSNKILYRSPVHPADDLHPNKCLLTDLGESVRSKPNPITFVKSHQDLDKSVSKPMADNRNMSKSKGWTLQSSLLTLWMEKTRVNNQTKIDDDVNLLKTL